MKFWNVTLHWIQLPDLFTKIDSQVKLFDSQVIFFQGIQEQI